ncbi:MAG: phage holin family protein [Christensenellales bacterium]
MEVIQTYSVPVIMGICLCVGYIIKHSLDFIPNKYIPLIVGMLGLVINISFHLEAVTADVILSGLFSGLSSTGFHSMFKHLIENDGSGGDDEDGGDDENGGDAEDGAK